MAEKGIKIAEQSGGESVGTRDLLEQDSQDVSGRVAQIVDMASRPFDILDAWESTAHASAMSATVVGRQWSFLETTATMSTVCYNITNTSAMYKTIIDVGDCTHVIMYFLVEPSDDIANDVEIYITPLAFTPDTQTSDQYQSCFAFPPYQLMPVTPDESTFDFGGSAHLQGPARALTVARAIPTFGAKYIGYHVEIDGTFTNGIIHGYTYRSSLVSGQSQELLAQVDAGKWGGKLWNGYSS